VATRKKKRRGLKPRLPSRVKKRKGTKRPHGRYSELYGLGLIAAGLFLSIVLYAGWDGGMVGGPLSDGVHGFVGAAAYLVPLAFVGVGSLMVARSELIDFRPFRVGLAVLTFGLLTTLGTAQNRVGLAAEARESWTQATAIFTELGDLAEAEKVRAEQAASGVS